MPIVSPRKKIASKAGMIYLATDADREGEAISWHLLSAAKIDQSKTKRVVFHEITQSAVEEAFSNTRDLDLNLVRSSFLKYSVSTALVHAQMKRLIIISIYIRIIF